MSHTPTVVIADDHPFVCDGLRANLEPACSVVGVTHHGEDVLGLIDSLRPELLLLDLMLPGRGGPWLIREIKSRPSPPRILIVTMHADPAYAEVCLRAGADGYLLKTARASELREAVRETLAGRPFVSPEVHAGPGQPPHQWESMGHLRHDEWVRLKQLTPRQLQVLALLGRGSSSTEIGAALGVSVKAVEYHRSAIRRTLGIGTTAGLYRVATLYLETTEAAAGMIPGSGPLAGTAPDSPDQSADR